MYEVLEYVTKEGKKPFTSWLNSLKNNEAKKRILLRIAKIELGNFGDWKAIKGAKGVFELRENFGPGYRVYYGFAGRKIVLLLAGSDKADQSNTITKAAEYLTDYERRTRQ